MNRIVVALLVLTAGCSWMSSSKVRHYPNGSVDCSTSKAAPTVDVLAATTFGIGGLAAASDAGAAALLPLGIATLYAISASHGFKQADQCRRALEGMDTGPEDLAQDLPRLESEDEGDKEESEDEGTKDASVAAKPVVPVEVEIDASELEGTD